MAEKAKHPLVYSDVVKNGWIQPYKALYTMKDFYRLHKEHDAVTSRFILICSAAYYSLEEGRESWVPKSLHDVMTFKSMDKYDF